MDIMCELTHKNQHVVARNNSTGFVVISWFLQIKSFHTKFNTKY